MQKCRVLMSILVVAMSMPVMAQDDDFGIWGEVNVEKKYFSEMECKWWRGVSQP